MEFLNKRLESLDDIVKYKIRDFKKDMFSLVEVCEMVISV